MDSSSSQPTQPLSSKHLEETTSSRHPEETNLSDDLDKFPKEIKLSGDLNNLPKETREKVIKLAEKMTNTFEIFEKSNGTETNQDSHKYILAERIFHWSNGVLIPKNCLVLMLRNGFVEAPCEGETHSIVILPSASSNDVNYLREVVPLLSHESSAPKRLVFCNMAIDANSFECVKGVSLNLLHLNNCLFEEFKLVQFCQTESLSVQSHQNELLFHARILDIEMNELPDFKNFFSFFNFEQLILRCNQLGAREGLGPHFTVNLQSRLSFKSM